MPLLHWMVDGHGSIGISSGPNLENRRSLSEYLGLGTAALLDPPAPKLNRRSSESLWWEELNSPEAAQTPRTLVPSICFPPRHPGAYTSYSEIAQPGWESVDGQGIKDLLKSFRALSLSASSTRPRSMHAALQSSGEKNGEAWSGSESDWLLGDTGASKPSRRATFSTNSGIVQWSGKLETRHLSLSESFSHKVFLGGLPWDISEQSLVDSLRQFLPIRVEWPGREAGMAGAGGPRGYAYVTLDGERRVRALLGACRREGNDWYLRVAAKRARGKEVQVIPWAHADSAWVRCGSARLEPARTVFVGALHGQLTAAGLARVMNDLFAGVVYAGIDVDKSKYPIGSGRVTFDNVHSYVLAVSIGFVEIRSNKFTKKVQIDPYLEDSVCSVCNIHQGPYFCRDPKCFGYYCRSCWQWHHSADMQHKPLMRISKNGAPGGGMPSALNGVSVGNNGVSVENNRAPSCAVQNRPDEVGSTSPSISGTRGEYKNEDTTKAWLDPTSSLGHSTGPPPDAILSRRH